MQRGGCTFGLSRVTAFVDRHDRLGSSPLHKAAAHGYLQVVQLLVASRGNLDKPDG